MAGRLVMGILLLALVGVECSKTAGKKRTVYIFGDSTADVGTNSFLPGSHFRANFSYYGVDSPELGPTGRFSNGLNMADYIAILTGLERSPPPYFSVKDTSSMKKYSTIGMNFASGGSGILDETGGNTKRKHRNVVTLQEQINQFRAIQATLVNSMGHEAASNFLANSLFFISTGSNDIFDRRLSKSDVPADEFISALVSKYAQLLEQLIELGARKIGIISVPAIGCCPSQRIMNETGGCLDEMNEQAVAFHSMIRAVMGRTSYRHKDIMYSIGNTFNMTMDVLQGRLNMFNETKAACCGNATDICNPESSLCSDRQRYMFWDSFHPTAAASRLAALNLFVGGQRYVYPISFSQLAAAA